MKITVTGGTGFIGNYVVNALLLIKNIEVIVIGTSLQKAKQYSWFNLVSFMELDINGHHPSKIMTAIASSDKLIHLAWSGLPNYNELFHFENNLIPQYLFLKKLVFLGLNDITVTGTCFEYGMVEGPLHTSMFANPSNPYAIAKNTLRIFLQEFQKKQNFDLKWLRLFYMYGKGQSTKSILSQLEGALENGDAIFNMSGGEQMRDYLPVEVVANLIVNSALHENDGIYNICSGIPISIKELVTHYLEINNGTIKLNLGHYPYPDYEPMAFWGQ